MAGGADTALGTLSCRCEPLGEGTYRIELVVDNTGYMPTYGTERAARARWLVKLWQKSQLPKAARLIQGKQRENLGHLAGRNGVSAHSYFNEWGHSSRRLSTTGDGGAWIVNAKEG